MSYSLRIYRVPAALEDDFSAELAERGSLGCEVRPLDGEHLRVVAYFQEPEPVEELAADWAARGVEYIATETLEERDWLAEYRAAARPIEIGRGFVVDPRDDEGGEPGSEIELGARQLLRIPARAAFGTGSHESTRLVVEWLEELDLAGLSVLDVGTGSGILAFIAQRLGARLVVGFDLDPAAPLIARANAALNRDLLGDARPLFFAGRLAALCGGTAFNLALVNVLPERVLGEYPRLVELLGPNARVVSSGNLWQRREELARSLAASGLEIVGEKRDGEWAAYLLERSA